MRDGGAEEGWDGGSVVGNWKHGTGTQGSRAIIALSSADSVFYKR